MSTRICEELLDTLSGPGGLIRNSHPEMAIAVLEDYHLLGKRIVHSFLRVSSFDIRRLPLNGDATPGLGRGLW